MIMVEAFLKLAKVIKKKFKKSKAGGFFG